MRQFLQKVETAIGPILNASTRIIFIIFAVAAIIICFWYQGLAIPNRYSLDYGEAPLVDQAMRLAAGQNIYRSDLSSAPYTISNYPPLYVAIVAIAVNLFGPAASFLFGRIISALSAWIVGLLLAFIVYSKTKDRLAGIISGTIFIALPFVTYWSPLLRIDMLALALSVGGLALIVQEPLSKPRFVAAAVLLTAAIFTRQSYALAAPFAAFIWLLAQNWRKAFSLAAVVGGATLIIFLILNTLTHGGFYYNIVTANVNEFGIERMQFNLNRFRDAALLPLIIGVFSLGLLRKYNPLWMLAAPYLLGASLSALTIGKIGSNVNYLLELCAATSLAAGVVIAWSRSHLKIQTLQAAFMIVLILGLAQEINITLRDYTGDLLNRLAINNELRKLDELVAKTPGAILADEYMGMLTLQGRPLTIQPFEVTQLAWNNMWDQTPLLESIKNHEFSAIIIYDKPWAKERWTQEMLDTIKASYVLTGIFAENKVYQPIRPVTEAVSTLACAGSAWQLPSASPMGIKWQNNGLDFSSGQGQKNKIAVYAVADGLLTRQTDWFDAVAVLHDDPLQSGSQVWTYYAGMAAANGVDSFVSQDFPPGSTNVTVKAGQLIGYQGTWSGKPLWATWTHMHFAVIKPAEKNNFPANLTHAERLDPTQYLKLALLPQKQNQNLQKMECAQP